ncbi:hypothetical protein F2A31_05950 [Acinetobacter suaedae]|uniref:Uncharacterized protein n=1 Tax=Acinetobacter suaedae TaxID=2609668 RepID=A0A5P1UUH1_9GAMM|nr:hypothetical protein [Acinetobacter sp. C16S1]QER39267.1 hypothetical protein F2A31_05950 [Acinetobacter sp. C16S1]
MDHIVQIITLVVSILTIATALFSIRKFFLENSINQRKQLREDFDGLLLALENTSKDDSNRDNILDLAETKKYQLIVGIPKIDRGKAQYLLKQKDKTGKIDQYKRGSSLVEFSKVEDKFNFVDGFKVGWIRAIKKWGSLSLYGIFFLLAASPVFFWNLFDPDLEIYNRIVSQNSVEGFWAILITSILMFLFLAFTSLNYSTKIYFAEKLVKNEIDKKALKLGVKQKVKNIVMRKRDKG